VCSSDLRALDGFKTGKLSVLVATDIAARGLDIDQLPHVVNFELPNVPEDYVHRIGRTGRAGSEGSALSLVDQSEIKYLGAIERLIKQRIPRSTVQGWAPDPSRITPDTDDRPPRAPRREGRRSGPAKPAAGAPRNDGRARRPHSAAGQARGSRNGDRNRRNALSS